MNKFLTIVSIIVFSTAASLAQGDAVNEEKPAPAPSTAASEIDGLKAEIRKLNALLLMLQEKNKLATEVEALKKQIEMLQRAGSTNSKPATPTIANSDKSTPTSPVVSNPTSSVKATQNPLQQAANAQTDTCLNMSLTPESYSNFDKTLCDLAKKLVGRKFRAVPLQPAQINFAQDRSNLQTILLATMLPKQKTSTAPSLEQEKAEALRKFILEAEDARTDKQLGSDSKAAGSTSLVVKGGMPRFLSFGMENGSVEGSRDGNTLTFRVNPLGLLNTLTQPDYINRLMGTDGLRISPPETSDAFNKFLNNLSVGFSFDITRGTDPPTFIGSKQQLSAVSARYQFLNRRDPTNSIYRKEWEAFADNTGSTYLGIIVSSWDQMLNVNPPNPTVFANAVIQTWLDNTNTAINGATVTPNSETDPAAVDEMYKILNVEAAKLSADVLRKDAVLSVVLTQIGQASLTYAQDKNKLLDKIKKGDVISAEFTNYREVNAPDMSNFRFIAQKHLAGSWSMDFNSSITFFSKKPTAVGMQRIRDFDFALQFETPLRDLGFGKPIFSFAGKYQRLKSDAIDSAGAVKPNTKGDIAYGQAKFVFPIGGTGLKLPISFSFANRKELIKEKRVFGANFGLTFDFDQLFLKRLHF